MSNYQGIRNKIDGKEYFVSIIATHQRVTTTISRPPFELSFEAAIFEGRPKVSKLLRKPVFIIQKVFDEVISELDFTKLIHSLVANENVANLVEGDYNVYSNYGYVAILHDFLYLLRFSKIRHIFLLKKPEENNNNLPKTSRQ